MVEATDDLGLITAPDAYASRKCKTCNTRGTITLSIPIDEARAKRLIADNPANEALLHQKTPGRYEVRRETMCGCARTRHNKMHSAFGDLLVSLKLATHEGVRFVGTGRAALRVNVYKLV